MYDIIKSLCNLVKEFSEKYIEKKKEKNIVDYSDVEHYALNLLLNNSEIAENYKKQFDEILIDEYQDSNLIQEHILSSISNNRMFMVGDVKQSIYRFRHARPELFLEKYKSFKLASLDGENSSLPNKKVLLFKNFRSNENIIDEINYLFQNIMSEKVGEVSYDEDEYLKFGASHYTKKGEKAELVLIETKNNEDIEIEIDDTIMDANANLEGRYIAKKIKELVGNIDVFDNDTKTYRKAKYRDFVILLRSTVGRLEPFMEELSNLNIPVFADNGGDYFENMEVQTILSYLRIIDNPYQDIPLVAVMRSQIGGFTVDELSYIRLVDRKASYYEALIKSLSLENDLSKKVSTFLDKLNSYREKCKHIPLWELIWQIYNDTGYYSYVSLFPDGVKRQSNLKLLMERAEEYEKTSFKGLFNFLNYIDNIKESSRDFTDSKMVSENDDVVRIMSVHKSKGLEFPIVFLAGTDKRFNKTDLKDDVVMDLDLGFGLDVIDYDARIKYQDVSKNAVSLKYSINSLSEEMRILYVALTRAREKIIVTALVSNIEKALLKYSGNLSNYKIENANSFLDWIGNCVIGKKQNFWNLKKVPYSEAIQKDDIVIEDNIINDELKKGEFYNIIDDYMNWQYSNTFATKLQNKISISEIKRRFQNSEELGETGYYDKIDLIQKPKFMSEVSDSGNVYGTMIHEVLEKIDFRDFNSQDLKSLIATFTDEKLMQNSIYNKILNFSNSELFSDIKKAEKVCRETAFNLNIKASKIYNIDTDEMVMIQGIIDLYFFDENGKLVLVDYKTDNVEKEDELISRYKIQLDLYKEALQEIYGLDVYKSYIYSFKFGKAIEV